MPVQAPSSQLSGLAGAAKPTVATSVVASCDEEKLLLALRQTIDKDVRDKSVTERNISNNMREAKFLKSKFDQIGADDLKRRLARLEEQKQILSVKREHVKELSKIQSEFDGVELTNSALKQRIDELKKSRLSLEMSFVD